MGGQSVHLGPTAGHLHREEQNTKGKATMTSITVPHSLILERILSLEIVRVTERAAVKSAQLRGRGEEKAADQAAVDAMRRELNNLPIDGTVVIGEGERDEAPILFIVRRSALPAASRSILPSIRWKAR